LHKIPSYVQRQYNTSPGALRDARQIGQGIVWQHN